MTEKRLRQIAYEQGFDRSTMEGNSVYPRVLELLKVAVNEALEEVVVNTDQFDHIHKDEILNLKVK